MLKRYLKGTFLICSLIGFVLLHATGEVDAIVYDAPVLQHYASNQGQGQVKIVGFIFQEQNYGVALPVHSPYREQINLALLQLIERGEYQELYHKWFGAEQGGEQ